MKSILKADITPVFVGGTGRSGTTIVGDLLNCHEDIYLSTPTEIKFLSNNGGLLDAVFLGKGASERRAEIARFHVRTRYLRWKKSDEKARGNYDIFKENLFNKWWDIDAPPPHGPGVISGISEKKFLWNLRRLDMEFRIARVQAVRRFMYRYISQQDSYSGERFWIETTPMNILNSARLLELFPNALFVNMLRDPRDTIASLLTKDWGPTDPIEGLRWIESRLLNGHRSLSLIPPEQVLTISLEDLCIQKRDETYQKLLVFLKVSDSMKVKTFFNESMKSSQVSAGRWIEEIDSPEFRREFDEMCIRLDMSGVAFSRIDEA